ncbi:MAG: ABC transporter ATP-binding protein [Alphaproteobacteria bacterium]|nr:ABC transporter ATP-binding protein [Alphaproteobacteria bacterium]
MAEPILSATGIVKTFGGFTALDQVDFSVERGERVGLLGPNGSGKSTLVNCITGTLRNDAGQVIFADERIDRLSTHQRIRRGMARTFQIPRPFHSMTVRENIEIALLYAAGPADSEPRRTTHDANADDAMRIVEEVGLHKKADERSGSLTQVDLRKLELARAMAAHPRLLIADEAMAGLSTGEVDEILALLLRLNQAGVSIVMIEHIMYAVMKFAQRIAVLVAGRKIADGDPQSVIANPDVQKAYLGE